MIRAAALCLLSLHRVDGGDVFINPAQVTSLRVVEGALSSHSGGGRCLVGLTDRKFVSVLETCVEVRTLLERVCGTTGATP